MKSKTNQVKNPTNTEIGNAYDLVMGIADCLANPPFDRDELEEDVVDICFIFANKFFSFYSESKDPRLAYLKNAFDFIEMINDVKKARGRKEKIAYLACELIKPAILKK